MKLYNLVNLIVDEDASVRQALHSQFTHFLDRDRKSVQGFSKILQAIIDSVKEYHTTLDTKIVDIIREFFKTTKSKGTCWAPGQEANDEVLVAYIYENKDDSKKLREIKKHLGVTSQAVAKVEMKVKTIDANCLRYDHTVWSTQSDCKLDRAFP